jgi:serine protease
MFRYISFVAIAILFSYKISISETQVYSGRYIISFKNSNVAQVNSKKSFTYKKKLGISGHHLVTLNNKRSLNLLTDNNIAIQYSKEKDLCPELLADTTINSCSPDYLISVKNHKTVNNHSIASKIIKDYQNDILVDDQVVVAIVDTGIDYNHPALSQYIWTNPLEIPGNNNDDDGNGFIDDIHGVNLINDSVDSFDDNGHGTHVAGIIVNQWEKIMPKEDNRLRLLPLKFLDENGTGALSAAIDALSYLNQLQNNGIKVAVSNNSWGGAPELDSLTKIVSNIGNMNTAFVTAAGNWASNNDIISEYPANYKYPFSISVAAVDASDNLASFSNFGVNSVTIAAYGVGILSTAVGGGYKRMSGTSMAAPMVSGILAAIYGLNSQIKANEAIEQLLQNSKEVSALKNIIESGKVANETNFIQREQRSLLPVRTLITKMQFLVDYQKVKRVRSGKLIKLALSGSGDGIVKIKVNENKLTSDFFNCSGDFTIDISNGKGSVDLSIPSIFRKRKLYFSVLDNNEEITLKRRLIVYSSKNKSPKYSSKNALPLCGIEVRATS